MSAAIVVTPNQWNTLPDASGNFTISGVPRGRYTVVAWHKTAGFFRHKIDIGDDHVVKVEFLIPVDENGIVAAQR